MNIDNVYVGQQVVTRDTTLIRGNVVCEVIGIRNKNVTIKNQTNIVTVDCSLVDEYITDNTNYYTDLIDNPIVLLRHEDPIFDKWGTIP